MTIDEAREYVVIVNGGSGIIFQPSDTQYTYILTAKHNVEEDQIKIIRFSNINNIIEELPEISIDKNIGVNIFPHYDVNKDIAIIKIDKIRDLEEIFRIESNQIVSNIRLMGYPLLRRQEFINDKASWFRDSDNLSVHGSRSHGRIEARLQNREEYSEIVGHSGGGVVSIEDGKLLLMGIQNSMLSSKDHENLGSIEYTPIKYFDEIINKYQDELKPLHPHYLSCFSFLTDSAFSKVDNCFNSKKTIDILTKILKEKSKKVIESEITPICIKEYLSEELLLLKSQNNLILNSRDIWVIWLELLTILIILKNDDVKLDKLHNVLNRYRVFYSDIDDDFWVSHVNELPNANYSNLKKGGTVIVATRTAAKNNTHKLDSILGSIYQTAKDEHDIIHIDDAQEFPFDKYKYLNISAFKEGVLLEHYKEFLSLDVKSKVLKLQEFYRRLLND